MKTSLFISRHGAKDPSYDGVWTGHLDVALSTHGAVQAKEFGESMRSIDIDVLVTSTMKRGVASGTSFLEGYGRSMPHLELDELREMSHGNVDGLTSEQMETQYPWIVEAWKLDEDPRFPAGESFKDVENRVVPIFEGFLEEYRGKTILFIGHKSVNMVLLGYYLRMPRPFRYMLQQHKCHLSLLTFNEKPKLSFMNVHPKTLVL